MKAVHVIAMIGLAAAAAAPALGQSVINRSFEVGPNPGIGWTRVHMGSTVLNGWTVDRGNVDHVGSQWAANDGTYSIDLNGNRHGRINQVIDTIPGMEYVVSFALSGNWGGVANKTLRVTAAQDTALYTVFTKNNNGANMNWTDQTFRFTAIGSTTKVLFASQNRGSWGVALDNININAVPAPASALALAGLAGLRRRRR